MQIMKVSIRLVVALLTFIIGVAITLLWVVPHLRGTDTPSAPKVGETLKKEESLPDGWKKLEVKNSITMWLPQDMKPAELIGDSFAYREAYENQDIYTVIVYGEVFPRRHERDRPIDACDTPPSIPNEGTNSESVINIEGRKAKLSVNHYLRPEYTAVSVCFPQDDKGIQLIVAAYCKNDHAVQIAQQIVTSIRFEDSSQTAGK